MQANQTITPVNEDAVRQRAYLIWEADGRPFGRDDHYWHLAMSEITTSAGATDKPKRAAASSVVEEKTAKPKAADKKSAGAKAKKK
jgi:hypothetical protein